MKNINSAKELKEAIRLLEIDRDNKLQLLKSEINIVVENIKPSNVIKNVIKNFIASPDLKDNLIDGAIGLVTGYLSKKLVVGNSSNPIKNIFGNLIELGMASIVSKNADGIKSTGRNLLKSIFSKKTE